MHPDTIRRIDRYVGVPACGVLTAACRLFGAGQGSPLPGGPRRILFIGLAEIGALVVAYPAIDLARQLYPEAELHFLTFDTGRPMLRMMGFAEERIVTLDAGSMTRFAGTTLGAVLEIRRRRIDTVVSLEIYVRFAAILSALSGASRRFAFHPFGEEGHYIGDLTTHRLVYSPHRHAAQGYMALVRAAGEDDDTTEPRVKRSIEAMPTERLRVTPDEAEKRTLREKLRRFLPSLRDGHRLVILNANASDLIAQRRWPVENYAELARRLLEDPEIVIVLTGTADEYAGIDRLARRIDGERIINLAGATTLRELITLYDQAAVLVTNDSGPAHFASVTDLPTVALFGPETPRIFGPLGPAQEAIYLDYACSPCVSVYNQKRSPCTDNRCMKDIGVDRVLAAAKARMRQS
jgi:lipopolysaccharide heptosyltransferase II